MRAAITEKGTFDDDRDDAPTAIDVPGLGEAAYYEPAAELAHASTSTTRWSRSRSRERCRRRRSRAAEEALVAKIVPRL